MGPTAHKIIVTWLWNFHPGARRHVTFAPVFLLFRGPINSCVTVIGVEVHVSHYVWSSMQVLVYLQVVLDYHFSRVINNALFCVRFWNYQKLSYLLPLQRKDKKKKKRPVVSIIRNHNVLESMGLSLRQEKIKVHL